MNNLFKNAYFSKPYKTRDGRKAIYIGESAIDKGAVLIVYEGSTSTHRIMKDGHYWATPNVKSGIDIVSEWEDNKTDYLKMFTSLPHLDDNKKIVDDWGYIPNLYYFDTKWIVSWTHCLEGDSLVDFMGDSPEEAIEKAYNFISELIK